MSGIIGAHPRNGVRVAGVNHDVQIVPVKILNAQNIGSAWDAAQAIRHASEVEIPIVALPLGGACESRELLNAIITAQRSSLLVVAAGNAGQNIADEKQSFYPPSFRREASCQKNDWCFRNVLVVGATDLYPGDHLEPDLEKWRDRRAFFSNYGTDIVDIGAPGVGIVTTGLEENSGVAEITGTSASTALVAGSAALVATTLDECGSEPSGTSEPCYKVVKDRILKGADRICELAPCFSAGRRLNVYNAVMDKDGSCCTGSDCRPCEQWDRDGCFGPGGQTCNPPATCVPPDDP